MMLGVTHSDLIGLLLLPLAFFWVRFMARKIGYKYQNPFVRVVVFSGMLLVVTVAWVIASAVVQGYLSAWRG